MKKYVLERINDKNHKIVYYDTIFSDDDYCIKSYYNYGLTLNYDEYISNPTDYAKLFDTKDMARCYQVFLKNELYEDWKIREVEVE